MERTEEIHLRRFEASRNIARFYRLAIAADLFGGVVVCRQWGRVGTRGRTRRDPVSDIPEAKIRIERLLKVKRRRGYRDLADC